MITIYFTYSNKTERDYVQFESDGYFYEIDRKNDIINTKSNIELDYRSIENEEELNQYSDNKLSIIVPERILILVNRKVDKKYVYLKIGYDRFLPIERNDLEDFLNYPLINQFDISTVSTFSSVLSQEVLDVSKSRRIEKMIKVHVTYFHLDIGLLWIEMLNRKSYKYCIPIKNLYDFLKKSLSYSMIDVVIHTNPARMVASDKFIENMIENTTPIIYERISNTLVGFFINQNYQILQVEALTILLSLLPKGILVERK